MVGFLIAVLSGVLMSVQGIFNTQVTKASSIWSANVFVQATALLSCLAVWLAADRSNLFAVFRSEPKYLLLGGVLGAGITWTVIKAMAMLRACKGGSVYRGGADRGGVPCGAVWAVRR